jgi:hypothetical protein
MVTSGNAVRLHWRGTGRYIEGLRNGHHTAIHSVKAQYYPH